MNIDNFMKYSPIFYKDANEPFTIQGIGCTEYKKSSKSVSSKFNIEFSKNTASVYEYAVYWDFDIQHLYDLEHVFVFVNEAGDVIDVISSFHGKFYRQSDVEFVYAHPVLYLQPGKHAIMAHPEFFKLYVDLILACNEKAGLDGILVPDFLEDKIKKTDRDDKRVSSYIKNTYSFTPAFEYIKEEYSMETLKPWKDLLAEIPERIQNYIKMAK